MKYQELGYDSYDEYLSGDEWQEIKNFYFKHCGPYRCEICGAHWRLLLHKRSYRFLSMKQLRKKFVFDFFIIRYLRKYMCWLCFPHNGEIHFKNKKKLPLRYEVLFWRENEIKRQYMLKRILNFRLSDLVNRAFDSVFIF